MIAVFVDAKVTISPFSTLATGFNPEVARNEQNSLLVEGGTLGA